MTQPPTDGSSGDSRRDDWLSVGVISAAVAVVMLDTFGVSQSLSTIGNDLGATDTELVERRLGGHTSAKSAGRPSMPALIASI